MASSSTVSHQRELGRNWMTQENLHTVRLKFKDLRKSLHAFWELEVGCSWNCIADLFANKVTKMT